MASAVFVALLALVAAVAAVDVDSIPHDKCGVTAFVNDATELELYALGEDRTLLHKRQLCTGGWTKWTSMGGHFSTAPSVLTDSEGLIHVFVRGMDRALWH